MTLDQFAEGLESLGLPMAYREFSEGEVPVAPYFIYYALETEILYADGIVYDQRDNLCLELYCDAKDPELEKKIETWLTQNELAYRKEEAYIETEKYIEIIYYTNV